MTIVSFKEPPNWELESKETAVIDTPAVLTESSDTKVSKVRRKYTLEEEMAKDVKLLLFCEISSQRIVKALDIPARFVSDVKMKKIHEGIPMRRFHVSTVMRLMEHVFTVGE